MYATKATGDNSNGMLQDKDGKVSVNDFRTLSTEALTPNALQRYQTPKVTQP
jgi:hypothetical protein